MLSIHHIFRLCIVFTFHPIVEPIYNNTFILAFVASVAEQWKPQSSDESRRCSSHLQGRNQRCQSLSQSHTSATRAGVSHSPPRALRCPIDIFCNPYSPSPNLSLFWWDQFVDPLLYECCCERSVSVSVWWCCFGETRDTDRVLGMVYPTTDLKSDQIGRTTLWLWRFRGKTQNEDCPWSCGNTRLSFWEWMVGWWRASKPRQEQRTSRRNATRSRSFGGNDYVSEVFRFCLFGASFGWSNDWFGQSKGTDDLSGECIWHWILMETPTFSRIGCMETDWGN